MSSKYIIKSASQLMKMSKADLSEFVRLGSKTAMSKISRLEKSNFSGFSQTLALYEEFKPFLKGKSLGAVKGFTRNELILKANAISNIMKTTETPASLAKMVNESFYDEWAEGTFGEWDSFEDFVSAGQTKTVIQWARANESFLRAVIDTSDDPELQEALEYAVDDPDKYYLELVRISSEWASKSSIGELDDLRNKMKYRELNTTGKYKDRRKNKRKKK